MDNVSLFSKINKKEIYRYLGYKGQVPDENVGLLIDEVIDELQRVVNPKHIYKYYNCVADNDFVRLWEIDKSMDERFDIEFRSIMLCQNLENCSKVVVLAATLGVEIEKLMYKYEIVNMTKASIVQACGAACIEAYCNEISKEIGLDFPEYFLRPRFSPGYGDFSLETQKIIFKNLECSKRLGLTLTDSLLMYPTKSVTAIIGLTKDENSCHIKGCDKCDKKDCEFRYED